MQHRIQRDLGVKTPGILCRGNPNLAPASFTIILDEVPAFTSQIVINHFFCTTAIPASSEAHLAAGARGKDPMTGDEGVWLSEDQVNALSQNDVVIYSDAEMLIRHIEVFLRQHLANFLGLQEMEELLDEWSKDEALSSRIDTILPNRMARLGFARLLRTLVREQIPILAAKDIFSAIEGLSLEPEGIASAIRAVRLRLRASLPANAQGLHRIELPVEMESSASIWLTRQNGLVRFDIAPEPLCNFIRDLCELIRPADLPTVIIVRDWELRPFLQRMVDFSWPLLMVQASEEVLTTEESREQALTAEPQVARASFHG